MERKFHGSEILSSLYGLFAPGNESAEERKGQLPYKQLRGRVVVVVHRRRRVTFLLASSPLFLAGGL